MAAGLSRRMGMCKQLLPLEGKPVIRHCLDNLLDGGISDIFVVIGTQGYMIAETIRNYPVTVVRTTDPDGDMAASVLTGRAALPQTTSGVMIALADHPLITPQTVALLSAQHGKERDRIIIPVHEGKKGHPTLFPRPILDELTATGTLRDLVMCDPGRLRLVEVPDQGVRLDMDTPEDYQMIAGLCRSGALNRPVKIR